MSTARTMRLEGVAKRYGETTAVESIDLEIPAGSYVVLLGPSGSGKTTLLSILGGFTVPSEGRVLLGDEDVTDVPPARRLTVTVFQDYALFPHLSVADNVGFGLSVRRMAKAEIARKAEDSLSLVGLPDMGRRQIHELSGGQKQRVALARAIALDPAVLLLDEPLGALDLHLRRQMQDELRSLQRATAKSFVHVTHDQEEAMALADQIVIMKDGRIEDVGPPGRVYSAPRTRFAATFMGESSILDGRVVERREGKALVETAQGTMPVSGDLPAGATLAVAVRPEKLLLGPAGATTGRGEVSLGEATVRAVTFQGSFARVTLTGEAGTALLAKVAPETAPEPGARAALAVSAKDLMIIPDR
jgi:spermidine/putrescine transport system ATP-binding protein